MLCPILVTVERKLYAGEKPGTEQQLRAQVEPGNTGKFLVIDIETGEYEIDHSDVAALKRAKAKRSDAPLYMLRIGHRGAYQLLGSTLRRQVS